MTLVYGMLNCSYGKKLTIEDYSIPVANFARETINIPIPRRSEIQRNDYQRIESFMDYSNISNYLYLDLNLFDPII